MLKNFYEIYSKNFSLGVIVGYVGNLIQLYIMYTISKMFNGATGGNTQYILNETPKFILIVLAFIILKFLMDLIVRLNRQKNKEVFKYSIYQQLLNTSFEKIEKRTFGEVITRLDKDLNNIIETLDIKLSLVCISVLTFITYFIYLFKINFVFSIIVVLLGSVTSIIPLLLKKKYDKAFADYYVAWEPLENSLNSTMKAFDFIKLSNLYVFFQENYLAATKGLSKVCVNIDKITYTQRALKSSTENLGNFSMYGVIAFLLYKDSISFGQIIICVFLGKQLLTLLSGILNEYHNVQNYKICVNRLNEILQPEEPQNGILVNEIHSVCFNKVSFAYADEKTVLRNIDLSFKKGEKILIEGSNGTGKSTLIKLILNLYNNFEGQIRINDLDVFDINKSSYNKRIGYVPQQQCFLVESAFENLILFKNDMDVINNYCERLNFSLDEIKNKAYYELSGGQKQKICLIRALAGDFDLLILDEPTNYLDNKSIEAFKEILRTINKKTTVIVITHDPSLRDIFEKRFILKDGYLETEDLNIWK